MDHAKKLILVEPRVLEELQAHREYKELEKPAYKKSKTGLSMEAKKILSEDHDDNIPDDIKAKLYQQAFSHFLNLKNRLPFEQQVKINRVSPAPAPPSPLAQPPPLFQVAGLAPSAQDSPVKPQRKSARKHKTPPYLKSPFIKWDSFTTRRKK